MAEAKQFPHPPRLTGFAETDIALLAEYVWALFRSLVLESGGVIQFDDLEVLEGVIKLKSFSKLALPDAEDYERGLIYVSDEAGGAVPAFSDGTSWRRVTDRAVVS